MSSKILEFVTLPGSKVRYQLCPPAQSFSITLGQERQLNGYNYGNENDSSKDSDSSQISEHDLAWLLVNSDTATGEVLIWEYAQEYNISIEEVQHQLRQFYEFQNRRICE